MPFQTQRYVSQQDTLSPASGEIKSLQIGRSGYYGRLRLAIRGQISSVAVAAPGFPRDFGLAGIIKRVRLKSNFTRDLYVTSGEGYHYLLAPRLGQGSDPLALNNARNRVDVGLVQLDMIIPICLNIRDCLGTIVGGNEESLFTLEVERRTDASMGITGWTTQPTIKTELEWFEGSFDPALQPDTSWLHQVIEDQFPITAQGTFRHAWERGGNVVAIMYGLGFGEIDTPIGVDGWNTYSHRYNQSLYPITNRDPGFDDIDNSFYRGVPRLPGTFAMDFAAQAGLWEYDQLRDMVLTDDIVDNNTLIDVNASGVTAATLYVVRRQLVPITVPGQGATGQAAGVGGRGR